MIFLNNLVIVLVISADIQGHAAVGGRHLVLAQRSAQVAPQFAHLSLIGFALIAVDEA